MIAGQIRKSALLNWRLRLQTFGIYRDPAIPGGQTKIKTGGSAAPAASRPGLAPESALRLHPCSALSSAPVRLSVERHGGFVKVVIVADREK
jgi:hypothetical protein